MLNYAVIIQYLTQQLNIPNVRIAEWLNLDPSIISNIKNNKRKMQKDISYDVFYRDVFCQAEIGTDFQSVHSLYTYLQDKDCSNEVIDMAYSHYKEHRSVENAETFLLTLLKEVKYEKDAVSSKSASKSTHRSPSDAIAFITRYKTILSSDDRICLRKYALFYAVWELVSSTVSAV